MKKIPTDGITFLEPLSGAENLYFGTEIPHGDLYEAEELYRDGGSLTPGRLIFVKYPSGQVTEPVKAAPGQYFGNPVCCDGNVYALLADFEIIWPERRSYEIGNREAFLFRDGDELWFNRWNEEDEGASYRYWDETVVRNLEGDELFFLRGDVQLMPNGEKWLLG